MTPAGSGADSRAALATVLAPTFLRKLDRLRLSVRRSLSTRPGDTPMPRGSQGSGIEIEGHKTYGDGDDLRHLDWNAYGRLDQLLIRTFRAQREAPLHIFLDVSASMTAPAADQKLPFGLALAASLAYLSLRSHDPVRVVALSDALPRHHLTSPSFSHRTALPRLRDFLVGLEARGGTALESGIAAALQDPRTRGVAIVLSDFLVEPSLYEAAIGLLTARRFTVGALRLIGPGERDPTRLFRRAELVDAESGAARFVTLTPANLARYHDALTKHLAELQRFCTRSEVFFGVTDTATGLEHQLFHELPALGLVH